MRRTLIWLLCLLLLPLAAEAAKDKGKDKGKKAEKGRHDATSQQKFDDIEHWVARFDDPSRDEWQKPKALARLLAIQPGMVTADIGCGTGYFTVWLAALAGPRGKAYAVDIEPEMLEYVLTREEINYDNVETILAEPDDPKLPAGELDLILIANTWHHIDDRLSYLDKLAAALKPSGHVVVIDWHAGELPQGPPPDHKLARERVLEEFAEGGWELEMESVLLPYQYYLSFSPKR